MQRIYSRPKRRRSRWEASAPFVASGLGLVFVSLLFPMNSSSELAPRILTSGISVQVDRSSPAFAALEDTLTASSQELETSSGTSTPLVVGIASVEPIATAIGQANELEEKLIAEERSQTLETLDVVQTVASQVFSSAHRLPSFEVAVVNDKPTAKRAEEKPIDHPVKVISLSSLNMDREQFAKNFFEAFTNAPSSRPHSARMQAGSPKPAPTAVAANDASFAGGVVNPASAHGLVKDTSENQNAGVRQVVITGQLEFMGGIALTSSTDRVVVFREDEGEVMEPGAVWIRDARYEIFVESPVGRLIAELRAANGEVMGRGAVDLDVLPKIGPHQYRVESVSLKIGPVPHGIIGRVITKKFGKTAALPVMNTQIHFEQLPMNTLSRKDGTFEEKTIMEGSSVIVRAERPGHWGTLAFADAGTPSEITVFSDTSMKALMEAAAPRQSEEAKTSGIVWGRVTRGGKPVSGATVDLMTTAEEMRAVYFNSMNLPDPTLTATTDNGLYAYFPVSMGAHAVRAMDSRGATEPILFPADAHTVSQVDLELGIDRKAKVRVFDAFRTDWPLSAEVASAGRTSGTIVDRSGQTTIRFASGRGQLVLDADAGRTYERIRLMIPRDRRTIDFPMVQSIWLDGLRGGLRVDRTPETGTVVGFIQGTDAYRVSLDEESLVNGTRIAYFDSRGQLTRNDFGEGGGGFVIFNLPEGFRTVFVQPTGTTKAFAANVLVDSKVTNVVTRNLK